MVENDDEDFGSFSYDDEYFSESEMEEGAGGEEKKYSRLDRLRGRSRSRSRSKSRSKSRSRSRSESKGWREEDEEEEEERKTKVSTGARRKEVRKKENRRMTREERGTRVRRSESREEKLVNVRRSESRGGREEGGGRRGTLERKAADRGERRSESRGEGGGRGVMERGSMDREERSRERRSVSREGSRATGRGRREQKRYMKMGREEQTSDEEEEERHEMEERFDDEDDDEDERGVARLGRGSRLAVHESREELGREDKPAMQVTWTVAPVANKQFTKSTGSVWMPSDAVFSE